MGLDTSHGAWHGAYSAFMTWRVKIAEIAGLPPLKLMEGFYDPIQGSRFHPTLYPGMISEISDSLKSIDNLLPIKWECLKPSPLHILLNHSDCDGEIGWEDCKPIADELKNLLPLFPIQDQPGHIGNWKDKTQTFIDGLMKAFDAKENLIFR